MQLSQGVQVIQLCPTGGALRLAKQILSCFARAVPEAVVLNESDKWSKSTVVFSLSQTSDCFDPHLSECICQIGSQWHH